MINDSKEYILHNYYIQALIKLERGISSYNKIKKTRLSKVVLYVTINIKEITSLYPICRRSFNKKFKVMLYN